ncbi:MAG: hypothetical protein ACRD28_13165 [Acidobacteriaceae bacterium]
MMIVAAILLLWTLIMLAVHLRSRRLVERAWKPEGDRSAWLTLAGLARFEGLYYLAAVIYGAVERQGVLVALIAALALIHLVVWVLVERRPNWQIGASHRKQFLDRVQAFDWGESVALAYIAWRLVEVLH